MVLPASQPVPEILPGWTVARGIPADVIEGINSGIYELYGSVIRIAVACALQQASLAMNDSGHQWRLHVLPRCPVCVYMRNEARLPRDEESVHGMPTRRTA